MGTSKSSSPPIQNEAIRLLLVEDSDVDALLIERRLALSPLTQLVVDRARSLADALQHVRQQDYQLILLDLGLPDSDGAQTFERLLQAEVRIPVIVLTGNDEALGRRLIQRGAQDFLCKADWRGVDLARAITYAIERVQQAERLLRAERIAYEAQRHNAIGQLAAGMAHQFNNLLMAIGGYAHLLEPRVPSQAREDVAEILELVTDGAKLTTQLLNFSRRRTVRRSQFTLDELLEALVELLASLLGATVTLTVDLQAAGGVIDGDRSLLEQVVINLVMNAKDAMSGGGELRLSTTIEPGAYGTVCALLRCEDNGCGMDEPTRQAAFNPFFSTREGGTGLGLSSAKGIVEQHGGSIAIESTPGRGTVCSVRLPLDEQREHEDLS